MGASPSSLTLARRSGPVSIELVAITPLVTYELGVGKSNTNRIDHTWFVGAIERLCSESLKLGKTVIASDLRDILQINSHRIHVARQDDVKVLGCLRGVAKS